MRSAQGSIGAVLAVGLFVVFSAAVASAMVHKVNPGESIQEAVDAAAPGDTVKVYPGDYMGVGAGSAAVRITKSLKLIAASNLKKGIKVRILPNPGQTDGILVEGTEGSPIEKVLIKGFTVEGFPNNGIWLRYVNKFKILGNESIDNLENGIWPTLSANGLVKKNVSYGSEDSALWVEASENVRVIKNELHHSPTGLEITVSNKILAKKNDIHDNSTGIGLYHPSAAGLPYLEPVERNGDWKIFKNHVYNNNEPNSAPPGSMSAGLPPGGGILVLGVDRVDLKKNLIENNDFYGIAVVDYCVAVFGTDFDCTTNPPEVEPAPDDNTYAKNTLINNGTDPTDDPAFADFASLAADITYIVIGTSHINTFEKNTCGTFKIGLAPPVLEDNTCSP